MWMMYSESRVWGANPFTGRRISGSGRMWAPPPSTLIQGLDTPSPSLVLTCTLHPCPQVPYFVPDTPAARADLAAQYTTIGRMDQGGSGSPRVGVLQLGRSVKSVGTAMSPPGGALPRLFLFWGPQVHRPVSVSSMWPLSSPYHLSSDSGSSWVLQNDLISRSVTVPIAKSPFQIGSHPRLRVDVYFGGDHLSTHCRSLAHLPAGAVSSQ